MYIEDLVSVLVIKTTLNPFDSKLVYSFYDQLSRGLGFTEKQSAMILKILKRQIPKLSSLIGKDITPYIDNPQFKLGIRTLNYAKRISIIAHPTHNKVIKVEFPFNEQLVNSIRKEKENLNHASWEPDQKAWNFSLDESSIRFLAPLVIQNNFLADLDFEEYVKQLTFINSNIEKHVPMLILDNGIPTLVNVHQTVPLLVSTNIIEAAFEARKAGITIWDDSINKTLELNTHPVIKDFLNSDPRESFALNLVDHPLSSLDDIVKYLHPCIVIVPGGTQLEKLTMFVEFLTELGITHEEISVMFRLPKETGDAFNKFVKDERLNSPITELTKIVFVSGKIPKVVIESKKKFNCVINFNFYDIHYSLREYLKWHHNVIHVKANTSQKELNFGNV